MYNQMSAQIERYMKENNLTQKETAGNIGLSVRYISGLLHRNLRAGRPAWEKLNDFFDTDLPYPHDAPKGEGTWNVPDWVQNTPKDIRNYVMQEYYVDPKRARLYATVESYGDIIELRRRRADRLPRESSMAWLQ